ATDAGLRPACSLLAPRRDDGHACVARRCAGRPRLPPPPPRDGRLLQQAPTSLLQKPTCCGDGCGAAAGVLAPRSEESAPGDGALASFEEGGHTLRVVADGQQMDPGDGALPHPRVADEECGERLVDHPALAERRMADVALAVALDDEAGMADAGHVAVASLPDHVQHQTGG